MLIEPIVDGIAIAQKGLHHEEFGDFVVAEVPFFFGFAFGVLPLAGDDHAIFFVLDCHQFVVELIGGEGAFVGELQLVDGFGKGFEGKFLVPGLLIFRCHQVVLLLSQPEQVGGMVGS